MFKKQCASECTHSILKVEQKGRSAAFTNEQTPRLWKVDVDGCLPIEGPKADYVVEKGRSAIVIELKGRDVEHGATQATETAKLWLTEYKRCDRIAGLIVARQYPKASSSIQLKQQKFARQFRGPLHVVTKNLEFCFDNVLSFRGPHKSE